MSKHFKKNYNYGNNGVNNDLKTFGGLYTCLNILQDLYKCEHLDKSEYGDKIAKKSLDKMYSEYNITSPKEFRKQIAEIFNDLNELLEYHEETKKNDTAKYFPDQKKHISKVPFSSPFSLNMESLIFKITSELNSMREDLDNIIANANL